MQYFAQIDYTGQAIKNAVQVAHSTLFAHELHQIYLKNEGVLDVTTRNYASVECANTDILDLMLMLIFY